MTKMAFRKTAIDEVESQTIRVFYKTGINWMYYSTQMLYPHFFKTPNKKMKSIPFSTLYPKSLIVCSVSTPMLHLFDL